MTNERLIFLLFSLNQIHRTKRKRGIERKMKQNLLWLRNTLAIYWEFKSCTRINVRFQTIDCLTPFLSIYNLLIVFLYLWTPSRGKPKHTHESKAKKHKLKAINRPTELFMTGVWFVWGRKLLVRLPWAYYLAILQRILNSPKKIGTTRTNFTSIAFSLVLPFTLGEIWSNSYWVNAANVNHILPRG